MILIYSGYSNKSKMATSKIRNFQRLSITLNCRELFYVNVKSLQHSRLLLSSKRQFSASTRGHFQKDEPIAFSKSKARDHTVDESLGISKPKNSNFPIYLGLGLFSMLVYLSFIRKEPEENAETLEEVLERIQMMHKEKLLQEMDQNDNQVTGVLGSSGKD